MSLGFGEAVTAIEVVIEIWHKVKDAQEEVDKMGKQLELTKSTVIHVKQLIPKNKESILKENDESMWSSIRKTIKSIQEVARQAEQILKNWSKISSHSAHFDQVEWTNKYAANFAAVVKQNPGKLRDLREELVEHKNELSHLIIMLTLSNTLSIKDQVHKQQSQLKPKDKPSKPKSRSPSPRPPLKSIIFVDSYNSGRSVVSQSYMMLVREWTTRTKNHWPLQKVDSAGIRITSRSAFAEQLRSLKTPVQMAQGNTVALSPAINALFDQPYFNYQYKAPIRQNAAIRRSRGLPADIFSSYDHIFVFSREQREILESLREVHRAMLFGEVKKASSRAKIELLGDYGNNNKAEISAPNDDDPESYKKWQAVVSNVKTCTKAFLTQQCGWKTPDKKDAHLQGE